MVSQFENRCPVSSPVARSACINHAKKEKQLRHELLHFHLPNHGKLWKSLMRAHLGDYEELETELNERAPIRMPG